MDPPVQEPHGPRELIFIVGLVATLLGFGLVFLVGAAFWVSVVQSPNRSSKVVGIVTFAMLVMPSAWFMLESGLRLALNMPSQSGSVLAQRSWKGISLTCALSATWVLAVSVPDYMIAGGLGATLMGVAGWLSWGRYRAHRHERSVHAAA